ncbi:unnamed protein product [Paramecium sonneborni]|uniref:MORN repeat protein n=1 Tax=Paramecium sonneborni TaxID=65129 RepID=A0A8S1K425_9CILI|nr:unnamed protein product [Paramecium sonneborni]
MGNGSGLSNQNQDKGILNTRRNNINLLVRQITNQFMKEKIQEILRLDQELNEIWQNLNVDNQRDFTIALNGSYRGTRDENDRQCGFGELISDKQDKYCLGYWQDNELNGKGCTLFIEENQQYHYYYGIFDKGNPHGRGTLKYSDGSNYDGQWLNGNMTGSGTIYIYNTLQYQGYVKNRMMHGKGKLYLSSDPGNQNFGSDDQFITRGGIIMEGQFYEDNLCDGTIKSQTGIYIGQMKDGQMEGRGKFIWNENNFYHGEFKNNMRHGIGSSKNQNGQIEIAKWENDQKVQVLNLQ